MIVTTAKTTCDKNYKNTKKNTKVKEKRDILFQNSIHETVTWWFLHVFKFEITVSALTEQISFSFMLL
jgi:hypothetical protein